MQFDNVILQKKEIMDGDWREWNWMIKRKL